MASFWCLFVLIILAAVSGDGDAASANVTYDGRSLIVHGQHKILFSGSIHYPRSTSEMWPSLIAKAKAGGLDVIETYVFWNIHEPQQGQFDFSGRRDIVRFIKEIQAQGLYACLRIGPFIQGEWGYGGLPFWLHNVPGIVFRTDNGPFKHHMKRYAKMIIKLMKSEKLYASQGGPIILSQIENEYGMVEKAFRGKGEPYVKWVAKLAVELETGVPWVMCKQDDSPDPLINACNGRQCGETFKGPNSPNKPVIWTENWTSFYQTFGEEPLMRSAEDIAFHVALFIAKNGSYVNYYMYHGGTNFGRTASEFVIPSYYDQAPLDEYGLLRQPTWGHLKELHAAVKLCEEALVSGPENTISMGKLQIAFVFGKSSNVCAAFLVNHDKKESRVQFLNSSYVLAPKSIGILPDCKTVAFNTAKVTVQHNARSREPRQRLSSVNEWEEFRETVSSFSETSIRARKLLDHLNTTQDTSDYLWYTFRFQHKTDGSPSTLSVKHLGHVLYAFANRRFLGSMHGNLNARRFSLEKKICLNNGTNDISLLSVMVGLPDSGAYLERKVAGLRSVKIRSEKGTKDFNDYSWGYQIGLEGERLRIYTNHGATKVQWKQYRSSNHRPLTWYKTWFNMPAGEDPVALNLGSMGKGEAWVNGQSIGRYWVSFHTSKGNPSQTWYHVPRSFLKPDKNLLVILEEERRRNPLGITIDTVSITKVCSHVSHSHPPPLISWRRRYQNHTEDKRLRHQPGRRPKIQLWCPPKKKITNVLFASFGTPEGDCQGYSAAGSCHLPNSLAVVMEACMSKNRCSVPVWSKAFGDDPCPDKAKSLLVRAHCS